MSKGPVLIEMESPAQAGPDRAPPVPDPVAPEGQAMQGVMTGVARRPSRLARLFWGLVLGLLGVVVSVAAWDFATGLIARVPVLGYAVAAMGLALLGVALVIALREAAGFARLGRLDALQRQTVAALREADLEAARRVVGQMKALYSGRGEVRWGLDRLAGREAEQFDAEALRAHPEIARFIAWVQRKHPEWNAWHRSAGRR